jgi:hypothetical protein
MRLEMEAPSLEPLPARAAAPAARAPLVEKAAQADTAPPAAKARPSVAKAAKAGARPGKPAARKRVTKRR